MVVFMVHGGHCQKKLERAIERRATIRFLMMVVRVTDGDDATLFERYTRDARPQSARSAVNVNFSQCCSAARISTRKPRLHKTIFCRARIGLARTS
jgi:hypothetical protein